MTEIAAALADDFNRLLLKGSEEVEKIPEDGNEIEDEVLEAEFNEAERAYYLSDK